MTKEKATKVNSQSICYVWAANIYLCLRDPKNVFYNDLQHKIRFSPWSVVALTDSDITAVSG